MNTLKSLARILTVTTVTLLMLSTSVNSATTTTTFLVTATVLDACTVAATNLAFATYNPQSATDTDASSVVTPICTQGTAYTIGLNAGAGTGATVANRLMTNGADTLTYSLYRDAARTQTFGQTIGTDTVADTGTGIAAPVTVYGRIPALQNVPSALYSDTITVTITF